MNRKRKFLLGPTVSAILIVAILLLTLMGCDQDRKVYRAFERRHFLDRRDGVSSSPVCGREMPVAHPKCYLKSPLNPGATWAPPSARFDTEDYLQMIEKAGTYARPVPAGEVRSDVKNAVSGRAPQSPLISDPRELAITLRNALGTGFLFQNVEERPLLVEVVNSRAEKNYTESRLVFHDPWVGSFPAILRIPPATKPIAAVILIHGHGQTCEEVLEKYRFDELVDRGVAVIAPSMRANYADQKENDIALKLLENGFSLIGVRIYETLLVRKYLRSVACIDPDRIGLVAHSGGAANHNVLVRIDDNFAAYVTDTFGNYITLHEDLFIDETMPSLYRHHLSIADQSTFTLPVFSATYGFVDDYDEIFSFLDQHLKIGNRGDQN
jgi:hypothetical protein